jgi:uncharacterized membrane protein YraQ (UPF0718 family)
MQQFLGFSLRLIQSLAEASPFILTGFFVAAVFRRFLGYDRTRRLFSGSAFGSLLRAWAIGMLLPVCSLGVIPVVIELRRAGVRGGTILAFAMSAPLFNPLSLLYGLTLSEPVAILSFAAASLVLVTLIGLVWDKLFHDVGRDAQPDETVTQGVRRIAALGMSAARTSVGLPLLLIFCGLTGVGLLGAFLPHGALQASFNHDKPLAPVTMAAVGVPVYATPMLAMSQMGMMFQHANSIGAAFVLLILGAGMNLGLVVWMLREYGLRAGLAWMCILLLVVTGIAYAVQGPLFPTDVEPANHTHAFDIYCQPFTGGVSTAAMISSTAAKLKRDILPYEWVSLELLGLLIVSGVVVRWADRNGRLEAWVRTEPAATSTSKLDVVVPPAVLGGLTLVGLVVFSGVGCYAYYPPPSEVFEEMTIARTEALSAGLSGDATHAEYWIDVYQEWTRKLEVGTFLRAGDVSEYQHWKARLVREHLEMLKHAVEDGEKAEAKQWVSRIQRSHRRMRTAFLADVPPPPAAAP